jgi:2,4-didehydro-3-deoxy-L-rhamnonate hydrolase
MKLFKFKQGSKEKCGAELNGTYYNVSAICKEYDEKFFENGGIAQLKSEIGGGGNAKIKTMTSPNRIKFAAPFARPSKIVCIGLNYAEHARESGATPPTEPVVFMKATTSFMAPNDTVIIPRGSVKTDWEVELAVVIGKKASYVEEKDAMQYVAGYTLHNDISEREYQLERGGTWDKGKGCDTFAPMGPYLVTPDEIKDVDNLNLWLKVNGKMRQNNNTKELIFKIPHLISYVSQFMTLLAGDVISTGTPSGVGLGMKPKPIYLKAGDKMELGIEGLGIQKQVCKNYVT